MSPRARLFVIALLMACVVLAKCANAAWVDDAGSDKTFNATGGVSITLNAKLGVYETIPDLVYERGLKQGLTLQQMATQLLERYGPYCAEAIDLTKPHAALPVRISFSSRVPVPNLDLFVVDQRETVVTINYVPTHRAICVTPGALTS